MVELVTGTVLMSKLFLSLRTDIRSNLINYKSSGPEILYQIISSSNYREVEKKYIIPKISIIFFYQT